MGGGRRRGRGRGGGAQGRVPRGEPAAALAKEALEAYASAVKINPALEPAVRAFVERCRAMVRE